MTDKDFNDILSGEICTPEQRSKLQFVNHLIAQAKKNGLSQLEVDAVKIFIPQPTTSTQTINQQSTAVFDMTERTEFGKSE